MRCKDFRALYYDFRDDLIVDPTMKRRMNDHLAGCHSCARHHEALAVGTRVLRELDPIEPSDRFLVRLRCRIALAKRRVEPAMPAFGWPASLAATMLVAVVIVKGVADKRQADSATSQTVAPSPPVVQVAQPPAAVRTRFEALTPPDFRPPAIRFAPARLNLDSTLDTWPMTDSGSSYITVQTTLSR